MMPIRLSHALRGLALYLCEATKSGDGRPKLILDQRGRHDIAILPALPASNPAVPPFGYYDTIYARCDCGDAIITSFHEDDVRDCIDNPIDPNYPSSCRSCLAAYPCDICVFLPVIWLDEPCPQWRTCQPGGNAACFTSVFQYTKDRWGDVTPINEEGNDNE